MRKKLEITPWAYLNAAVGILLLPIDTLAAVIISVMTHELFHLLMLHILKIPVNQITVGWNGVRIQCGDMAPVEALLTAMAGPFGSFSLLIFQKWFPLPALFGMIQGTFNLLPIYPLDGGRMLSAIIDLLCSCGVRMRMRLHGNKNYLAKMTVKRYNSVESKLKRENYD